MPEKVIITDTSCLIVMSKINAMYLLQQLYQQIIVTEEIAKEYGETLPDWIEIKAVQNKKYQALLEATLDRGEASAIALAMDFDDYLLIIDDLKGRKEAKRLGMKITGTLGVLYSAKQKGFITKIKPYIEKLQECDFRISPTIINELLVVSEEK
jgi:predicted nucleic acid-binding protein